MSSLGKGLSKNQLTGQYALLIKVGLNALGQEWRNPDGPHSGEGVEFRGAKVNGTYRIDLRKNLVLFRRSGNLYFPKGKPVLGEWTVSTSFKKAARKAFGIQDEPDRSLKRFEFPGTTSHSRSTTL